MAALDAASMLAEEIRAQAAAALTATLNANQLLVAEHPSPRAALPQDFVRVAFGNAEPRRADNESVFVDHSFTVLFLTMDGSLEDGGRRLNDWAKTLRLTLSDRASDRSPLRTDPLPLSALDIPVGVVVWDISIGASSPGTFEHEGGFRLARTLEITVTTYETATG